MDVQLKRGLLDVCVLAAIRNEDSYGYKIIKDMKPYLSLSESTLYTILKRLESARMLTVRTAEHDGRLRKYYRITELGQRRIDEFKEEWQELLSIYRFVTKFFNVCDNRVFQIQSAVVARYCNFHTVILLLFPLFSFFFFRQFS